MGVTGAASRRSVFLGTLSSNSRRHSPVCGLGRGPAAALQQAQPSAGSCAAFFFQLAGQAAEGLQVHAFAQQAWRSMLVMSGI